MKPIVQVSLDLTSLSEALETAEQALQAGVDWIEAGTPLILAEGLHSIRGLRTSSQAFQSLRISRRWTVAISKQR